jgi:hypothetical protein
MANIPDTHVCNNLDSHFYQYTKKTGDQLNQQAVQIKKKSLPDSVERTQHFNTSVGHALLFALVM